MTSDHRSTGGAQHVVDCDVHGVAGVRLVGPSPAQAAAVAAQLGTRAAPLTRDPDIVVSFVPRLAAAGLRYVALERSGFTDDDFFLLEHRGRPVRVRLSFAEAGERWEVECEQGATSVPWLDALVKLVALRRGYLPVHGAAFEHEGVGVMVAGWAHGGKTSCLLAFAEAGSAFVSDDLVLLRGDGDVMFGSHAPVSLSEWQLRQLPRASRLVGRAHRLRVAAVRAVEAAVPHLGAGTVRYLAARALPALQRRTKASLPPDALFERVAPGAVRPDVVFLALSQPEERIRVEPADVDGMAGRLATLLRADLHAFFEQYLAFRFAFPARASEWLERVEDIAADALRRALVGKRLFVVSHPHPVALPELYHAMRPHVEATPGRAPGDLRPAAWRAAGQALSAAGGRQVPS